MAAFRGVPGELQLDFNTPLTIIYAPNGTGKSSVIDAAEWLLTGDVKRVRALSKRGGSPELRCKFAPVEMRMEVEGWFSRGEGEFRLLRRPEGWSGPREGDLAPRQWTGREVRGLFSPRELLKGRDDSVSPELEQEWIRSARFLTVSTLELLADTEREDQSPREAVLGGLLGAGELFSRADKFETFARHLNEGYGGEEGLAATRKELTRRKEELVHLRKTVADSGCNPPRNHTELEAFLLVLDEQDNTLSREARLRSALDFMLRQRQLHALEVAIATIEEKVNKIDRKREQALEAARLFREKANCYCAGQLEGLFDVAYLMFSRAQANEVFDSLQRGPQKNPFDWVARSSIYEFNPSPHFSMGQRQDLALAIFLARARGVKGTFFLDEPVIHLDDLNRVALMDTFRMLVLESGPHSNFIMTTARRDFVRHMAEKFANVPPVHGMPPLRIYELDGNPRVGVRAAKEWCAGVWP